MDVGDSKEWSIDHERYSYFDWGRCILLVHDRLVRKISMTSTLSPEHAESGSVYSKEQDVVSRLQDACKKRRRLEFELQNAVEQVKVLQALLNSRTSKYEPPRNFENRVRFNSKMMNPHHDSLINDSVHRHSPPCFESKALVLSSFNLDSVSSQ